MIVDSSALVAIMKGESDAPDFLDAIAAAPRLRMSGVNFVEAGVVIDSANNPAASRAFDKFVREAGIAIEPITAEQALIARDAYRDFGRGRHRARLNLGDCFAYALARATGEPLLFKGNDFTHTDVTPALKPRTRRR